MTISIRILLEPFDLPLQLYVLFLSDLKLLLKLLVILFGANTEFIDNLDYTQESKNYDQCGNLFFHTLQTNFDNEAGNDDCSVKDVKLGLEISETDCC